MTLRNAAGDILNKTELLALATQEPQPEAKYRLTAPVYETYPLPGEGTYEMGRRLKWGENSVVKQSEIDAMYEAAAVTTINPSSGAAAGGDVVTISGSNLGGTEGVTFGGTAATNVTVVNNSTVKATTPAGTAGAVDVVVQDDSGDVTQAGAFTYV